MRLARLLLFAVFAVACGGDSTSPQYSPAGNWFGVDAVLAPYPTLSMSLSVQGSNVSGTGSLDASPVTITGTYQASKSSAVLTLTSATRAAVTYNVTVILPNSMLGQLNGGAYNARVFSVDRQ